jgi:hypothetical protein
VLEQNKKSALAGRRRSLLQQLDLAVDTGGDRGRSPVCRPASAEFSAGCYFSMRVIFEPSKLRL